MTAHLWKRWEDPTKSPAQRFMGAQERRCEHCGAIQREQKDYTWGRITARNWKPPVGRCKPANHRMQRTAYGAR